MAVQVEERADLLRTERPLSNQLSAVREARFFGAATAGHGRK